MAKTTSLVASGAVKVGTGELHSIAITKVGTGVASWTIYDNPSAASGTIIAQGDGQAQVSVPMGDGHGTGSIFTTGLYIALAGTTNPTIVVTYD